jgi:chemotaxis methyl-accepting protein methylase
MITAITTAGLKEKGHLLKLEQEVRQLHHHRRRTKAISWLNLACSLGRKASILGSRSRQPLPLHTQNRGL